MKSQRVKKMHLYIVSLPRSARKLHTAAELTQQLEKLPGHVSIVNGRGAEVLTVEMDSAAYAEIGDRIPFASVKDYYELRVL